jgi:mono/diheme cytochrome c family protein
MSRETVATLLVLLPLLAGGGLVAWYGQTAVPGAGEPGTAVFNLTGVASGGVWTLAEVNGLNYWWKTFEPATLFIRLGDEVVLNLRSADLFHRFYIPAFALGPVDVEPGHMATVRFRADRAGVFQYYCTSMCGSCHFYMRGWIVVTAPGEEPRRPPPIVCQRCLPDEPGFAPRPVAGDPVALGAWLYQQKGCVTCHGPEGRGGVDNPNSANSPVPRHDTTAQKLFLASEEDAQALIELLRRTAELGVGAMNGNAAGSAAALDPFDAFDVLDEPPEIGRFPVVRARFENAREIVRLGRISSRLDPEGPEPPLQMPAWKFLVEEREIDALLAYFVSLYPWEEDGDA